MNVGLEDRCGLIKAVVCVKPDTYWEMGSECVCVHLSVCTRLNGPTKENRVRAVLKVNLVESLSR